MRDTVPPGGELSNDAAGAYAGMAVPPHRTPRRHLYRESGNWKTAIAVQHAFRARYSEHV